jgi:hypothetical protein
MTKNELPADRAINAHKAQCIEKGEASILSKATQERLWHYFGREKDIGPFRTVDEISSLAPATIRK